MAKYSELASKLLIDCKGFFQSLAEQNEDLREQFLHNASAYEQIGQMFAADPDGMLDDTPLLELVLKLLRDAATFFEALAENNESLAEQMAENASVFSEMADLLEEDPDGGFPDATSGEDNDT